MMAEVKVLIEGYAKKTKDVWMASSSAALIQDRRINIIFDPGINKNLLLERLSQEGLSPEDIDYVVMSHFHTDHNYLCAIFPEAKAVDDEFIYEGDREYEHKDKIPKTDIKIIKTPGHEISHCSLVVPTETGKVVVASHGKMFKVKK